MRGVSARVGANILWLVLISTALIVGAFLTFVTGVLFDDSYPVRVELPESGGVMPAQEVTVLGRAVGLVEDVELTQEGVVLTLRINGDQVVPDPAVAQVLRRSPIGEQAVDLRPVTTPWEAAAPGATITTEETIVPTQLPALLEGTVQLFEPVDLDSLSTVVSELAIALDGRGERLRMLNRDTLELNETLLAATPEFRRLIDSSGPVLEALRDHRFALAESFGNAADVAEVFAGQRRNLETLLDTGERTFDELDVFVRNTRADTSCLLRDLTAFNEMLLGPSTYTGANVGQYASKLDEFEQALARQRFFFQLGFPLIGQTDPHTGLAWLRVLLQLEDDVPAQYYPEQRPTPQTRPGAACVSDAWGLGVNAVRQPGVQPPHPTAPAIDYAPLAEGEAPRAMSRSERTSRHNGTQAAGPRTTATETGTSADGPHTVTLAAFRPHSDSPIAPLTLLALPALALWAAVTRRRS